MPSILKAIAVLLMAFSPTVGWRVAGHLLATVGGHTSRHVHRFADRKPRLGWVSAPRAAIRLSSSEFEPEGPLSQNGFNFSAAVHKLHTPATAAMDQQGRLRKTVVPPPVSAADPEGGSTVYLVGVGPGDVELLTVKALRLLNTADLVLYDRLIPPEILKLAGPQASMLYVGKEAGLHTVPQEDIHKLLLRFASCGRKVVRLKGGDPTVFGRGGEEMEYLERQGVRVNIVPGITAAAGIAANLGVPLTHRDYANSVRFITGHAKTLNVTCSPTEEPPKPELPELAWEQLADPRTTLVIYMGLSTLPELSAGLIRAGLPSDTPAVAVQDGTTPTQRVVAAQLDELPAAVEQAELRSPTLVVIGGVVSLLDSEATESAVAITRAAATASDGFSVEKAIDIFDSRNVSESNLTGVLWMSNCTRPQD